MCRAGLLAVRKTSVSGLRRSRSSEALDSFVEAAPVFFILPADFLEAPTAGLLRFLSSKELKMSGAVDMSERISAALLLAGFLLAVLGLVAVLVAQHGSGLVPQWLLSLFILSAFAGLGLGLLGYNGFVCGEGKALRREVEDLRQEVEGLRSQFGGRR